MLPCIVLSAMIYAGCIEEEDGVPAPQPWPVISVADLTVQEGDVDQAGMASQSQGRKHYQCDRYILRSFRNSGK